MQLDDHTYQQLRKALKPFISAKAIYNYYRQQHEQEADFKASPHYAKVLADLRQAEADWESAVTRITGGFLNPVLALELNGFPSKKVMEKLIIPPAPPQNPAPDTVNLAEILNKTRPIFSTEINIDQLQAALRKEQKP